MNGFRGLIKDLSVIRGNIDVPRYARKAEFAVGNILGSSIFHFRERVIRPRVKTGFG